jgi:hypothetical protein
MEGLPKPEYAINKLVPTDKYDFLIFDARSLGAIPNLKIQMELPEKEQSFLMLLDRYLMDSSKFILFFGGYYHGLNQERCPSANSKFTLFARLRELTDYLHHQK